MSRAVEKVKADMRLNRSNASFLQRYLAWLRSENPDGADLLEADLIEVFSDEKGLRVLKLLEKAVVKSPCPDGSDDRALREKNAVMNFVLDIERIVSNG
ncbi:hypothetical protein [Ruegeria lacuscaerulensis]|uniref:hypothetical protein n=1 Tax=Ruegeria lacuscaerulensis TaxID=55218 RepID=UPI00147FDC1E|nr:hypothetical protein [Ruegeria lacuscaerulensis]